MDNPPLPQSLATRRRGQSFSSHDLRSSLASYVVSRSNVCIKSAWNSEIPIHHGTVRYLLCFNKWNTSPSSEALFSVSSSSSSYLLRLVGNSFNPCSDLLLIAKVTTLEGGNGIGVRDGLKIVIELVDNIRGTRAAMHTKLFLVATTCISLSSVDFICYRRSTLVLVIQAI